MGRMIKSPTKEEVLVGAMDLRLPQHLQERMADLLSEEERSRAGRFVFPKHRSRFIAGRGCLRLVLGNCLGVDPRSLEFAYGPFGKPCLANGFIDSDRDGLHFNISHSHDVALFSVGRAETGVDIERIQDIEDAAELVNRFFSPEEAGVFALVPPGHRTRAFLNLWTRKEALLKATGEGIAHCLNKVQVGFLPDEETSIRALPMAFGRPQEWSLKNLSVPDGYIGAVAARCPEMKVQWFSGVELLREYFGHDIATRKLEGAVI